MIIKSTINHPYRDNKIFYTAQLPGVYVIYKNEKIVYVGYSSYNVYKTLYRHFQSWYDETQKRIVYSKNDPRIKVRVVYCSPTKAKKLETALIFKHKPKDNPDIKRYEKFKLDKKENKVYDEVSNKPITYNKDLPF
jgi:excinuclease UvrABC nuclease subunit